MATGTHRGVTIRNARPDDYGRVIEVLDEWWGFRNMTPMLPKLFFVHFEQTNFVAEGPEGELAGFLCGFLSQTYADEAYVHFGGVNPDFRRSGVGRALYERFFAVMREHGRTTVRCITGTVNERSVAFHTSIGFEVERVDDDYDGPGEGRELMRARVEP
jgi:ribosomal protein S18 acetylase RimI-like enzyme